jgi:ATP-dependent protease Clp ATPase subunit
MPFLQVESGDLIAYGLIPEFVGRFPILVSLSSLSEDQLVEVFLSFLSHLHVTGPISF